MAEPELPSIDEMTAARATLMQLIERSDIDADARWHYQQSVFSLTFHIQATFNLLLGGSTDTYGTHAFFDPSSN